MYDEKKTYSIQSSEENLRLWYDTQKNIPNLNLFFEYLLILFLNKLKSIELIYINE